MAFFDEDMLLRLQYQNFHNHLVESLKELRQNDQLTDVTLTCDVINKEEFIETGFKSFRQFRVHKLILCVSSRYFNDFFLSNPSYQNPTIMLREIEADDLEAVLSFIYNGSVQVTQSGLDKFLKTAKFLQVFNFDKDNNHFQMSTIQDTKSFGNQRVSQRKPNSKKFDFIDDDETLMDFFETNSKNFQIKPECKPSKSCQGKRQGENPKSSRKRICIKSKVEESDSDAYSCKFCKLRFWSSNSIRLHEDNHKLDTVCQKCGNEFFHPMILDEHLKSVCAELSPLPFKPKMVSHQSNSNTAKKLEAAKPILTGRFQVISTEDVFSLLHLDEIQTVGETTIPVRAKAGEVYAFQCIDKSTIMKHLRADGYMWKNKRTQPFPRTQPREIMYKSYFYARSEKGMTKEFQKHEYALPSGTRVLIHYLGDETKYKDRKHGNCKKSSAYFYRTSQLVADQILERADKKPLQVFREIMAADPGGSDGYLSVVTQPRDRKQIANVLMSARKKSRLKVQQ